MPVNWKDPEAFTRLLAAMVAAQDMKLDYRKIASMYGNGATYDSIEGRFRIIKKDAATMKAEVDTGKRPEAPARGAVSANVTPKKSKPAVNSPRKDMTVSGRIGKSLAGTSTKKRGNVTKVIKEEPNSSSSSFADLASTEEDEGFTADAEGASAPSQGGAEFNIYYDNDYVDDGMDVGAF